MAIKGFKYFITILLLPGILYEGNAQHEKVSLEKCFMLAKANYPAIGKMNLIANTGAYELQNISKRFLPQVQFSGQATYQSQTVNFADAMASLPFDIALPSISKDQYRIQGEVNQLLYDGGYTRNQKEIIHAGSQLQEQQLEAGLYAVNSRINNLYFSALLMDAQLKQNDLAKSNLKTQIQKMESALENGVAFRSSLDELKAEIVKTDMAAIEYKSNLYGFLKMLSLFIDKELSDVSQLEIPVVESIESTINRPELHAFDLQKSIFDLQKKQLSADYLPQVSAFIQGAYGRPTLNIIENRFGPWYVAGVRFNWNLGSLYTLSNRKNTISLNQQSVDTDKATFLFNTNLELVQQNEHVKKFTGLIQQDEVIIALRSAVTKSAEAQLGNGVITTHEYIQKANAEHQARQLKIVHEIQLLQSKYNQKFITGN